MSNQVIVPYNTHKFDGSYLNPSALATIAIRRIIQDSKIDIAYFLTCRTADEIYARAFLQKKVWDLTSLSQALILPHFTD